MSDSYEFSLPDTISHKVERVRDLEAGISIPLVQDNMDCLRFLRHWKDGASVMDSSGQSVSYSDAAVLAFGLTPPSEDQGQILARPDMGK